MARIPGNPEGTGFGSFLSGAGQGLTEQIGSLGTSLFKYKLQHDFEMDRLNKQLEAKARQDELDNSRSTFNMLLKEAGPGPALNYAKLEIEKGSGAADDFEDIINIFQPVVDKSQTIKSRAREYYAEDTSLDRKNMIRKELETHLGDTYITKNDQNLLNRVLNDKKIDASIQASELLGIYEQYIPKDRVKNMQTLIKDNPHAAVSVLPRLISDVNNRRSFYLNVLDPKDREANINTFGEPLMLQWEAEAREIFGKEIAQEQELTPSEEEKEKVLKKFIQDELNKLNEQEKSDFQEDFVKLGSEGYLKSKGLEFREKNGEFEIVPIRESENNLDLGSVLKNFAIFSPQTKGPDTLLNKYIDSTWKDNQGNLYNFRYNKSSNKYEMKNPRKSKLRAMKDWAPININEEFKNFIKVLSPVQ